MKIDDDLIFLEVAMLISCRHTYEVVSAHTETGVTARIVLFAVDGPILIASVLVLDANPAGHPGHLCLSGLTLGVYIFRWAGDDNYFSP
jgi:hypothetical protein